MTQAQVAARVGKDRTTVANAIRLLKLPDYAMTELRAGVISAGHAKALLSLPDDQRLRGALASVINDGLSVRGTERLAQRLLKPKRSRARLAPMYRHAEALLVQALGTKVNIEPRARGQRGRIVIDYHSQEDLTRLVDWLARTDGPAGV